MLNPSRDASANLEKEKPDCLTAVAQFGNIFQGKIGTLADLRQSGRINIVSIASKAGSSWKMSH